MKNEELEHGVPMDGIVTSAWLGMLSICLFELIIGKNYTFSWALWATIFFGVFYSLSKVNNVVQNKMIKSETGFSGGKSFLWFLGDAVVGILVFFAVSFVLAYVMSKTGFDLNEVVSDSTSAFFIIILIGGSVLDFHLAKKEVVLQRIELANEAKDVNINNKQEENQS